ncbi:PucR family transcriptional regulator [Gordonia sp. NPDC003376]
MNADWALPTPRMRELIRVAAEAMLHLPAERMEEIHEAMLDGIGYRMIAEEPALFAALRRVNEATVWQWVNSNIHAPGERVAAFVGSEAFEVGRDLVRRGMDAGALDSYRTSQTAAWRGWMDTCFAVTEDRDELRELLDVTLRSISVYIDDVIEAVAVQVDAEREELTQGTHAERMAAVTLLIEGAPISRARAEAQLGYPLTGDHTAAIVWTDTPLPGRQPAPGEPSSHLDQAADELMRSSGAKRRLAIVPSATSLWVWLPTATVPTESEVVESIVDTPGVRIAIGRPGSDLDGFRRSHLDATTTHRLLSRLASTNRIAHFQDIQLAALLTADLAGADQFVTDVLGDLATADAEVRHTVTTFIREQFNTSRTAEKLFAHRNTIVRRLAKADELLPRPLADNIAGIAAALDIVALRTGL